MKVRIQCPHCSKIISVPTEYAGKRGKCPGCGQVFQIPASLAPPSSPAPSPPPPPPSNVYDAENAGSGFPPLSDPTGLDSVMPGNGGMGSTGPNDLGYGLSDDLLNDINRQPTIPVSRQPDEPIRVPCPVCRELIVHGAAKCHHCGEVFDPVMKAHEKHRQSKKREGSGFGAGYKAGGASAVVFVIIIIIRVVLKILRHTDY